MHTINYHSDFTIKATINSEEYSGKPFIFTYYVYRGEERTVVASFDGNTTYSGCYVVDDHIEIPVNVNIDGTPQPLGIGVLSCKRVFFVDNQHYVDGVEGTVIDEPTDIYITKYYKEGDSETVVDDVVNIGGGSVDYSKIYTREEVDSKFANYYTKDQVNDLIPTMPSLELYATKQYVADYVAQHGSTCTVCDCDLSKYALKTDLPNMNLYVTNALFEQTLGTYASREWVVTKINEAQLGGSGSGCTCDLSIYALKTDLNGLASQNWVESKGYTSFSGDYNDLTNKPNIPTMPSLEGYATETWVQNYVAQYGGSGSGCTCDLSQYYNKDEVNGLIDTLVLNIEQQSYATQNWVESKGYTSFSGDYNDLTNKPNIPTMPSLEGYATETWVQNYVAQYGGGSGSGCTCDLSQYYTKQEVLTMVNDLADDVASAEYATQTWVEGKGYGKIIRLTQAQYDALETYDPTTIYVII